MEPSQNPLLPVTKPAMKIRGAQALAFLADGDHLVVSKAHATPDARIVALSTGAETLRFEKLPPRVNRIAVSDSGRLAAFGHQHRAVTVCDVQTGRIMHKIKVANDGEISGLLFAPGSETLIHATWEGLSVIDAAAGTVMRALQKPDPGVRPPMNSDLVFSPSGDRFSVCCTTFGTPDRLRWEIQTFAWSSCDQIDAEAVPTRILRLAYAPDGQALVVKDMDGMLLVRHESSSGAGEPEILADASFSEGSAAARPRFGEPAFSADGSLLAFVQIDLLGLWDWKRRALLGKWRIPDDSGAMQVHFSPQGDRIAIEVYQNILLYRVSDLIGQTP